MFSYSHLPLPLLALLFTALPALSGPTTPNDPFHDIAVHASKPPEQPICCLRPLTPLEETEEEVLLTFEEWKAKRLAEVHKEHGSGSHPPTGNGHKPGATEDPPEPVPSPSGASSSTAVPVPVADTDVPAERLSPVLQIPTTDRFNYASMDCSARVHDAHKSAKSASSILSSKKDRYMLSPCAEKQQFVVVELCDDIRIDTVQLANYEFFSGVFKDFSVSVSKTYTSGWVPAGMYKGKNTRGVQTFHQTALSDFYRFIRIDFHSHYGNEFYCPLSLLRVYGLTHLEHWKWDMWEDESRRKALEAASLEVTGSVQVTQISESTEPVVIVNSSSETSHLVNASPPPEKRDIPSVSIGDTANGSVPTNGPVKPSVIHEHSSQPEQVASTGIAQSSPSSSIAAAHLVGEPPLEHSSQSTHSAPSPPVNAPPSLADTSAAAHTSISSDTNHSSSSVSHASISASSVITTSSTPSQANVSHTSSNTSTQSNTPQSSRTLSPSSSDSPVHTIHSLTVVPPNTGGESIYRVIMNRLTALEGNTTLYARYVEEQIASVREMMRRIGEDVGRLEGIGMAQAQMYQRSVIEFDRHRKRLDLEHVELMHKVNRLTDEVILEKRLGIAQLCLLLAVLIFMALTRGSRGEVVHTPAAAEYARSRTSSMRDWGKRTLSLSGLSGEWMSRFRSPDRKPSSASPTSDASQGTEKAEDDRIKFPSRTAPPGNTDFPKSKRGHHVTASRKVTANHARTPTVLRSPMRSAAQRFSYRPLTPTGPIPASLTSAALISPRPPMQRAFSSGGGPIVQSASMGSVIGPVPKSAKRWARSAHLHEVKSIPSLPKTNGISTPPVKEVLPDTTPSTPPNEPEVFEVDEPGDLVGDVFSTQIRAPAPVPWTPALRKESLTMHLARASLSPSDMSPSRRAAVRGDASEGDAWVDTDLDSSDAASEGGEPERSVIKAATVQ